MTYVVGFNVVDFNDVLDLLMSDKEELSSEDLIEPEKASREEAGEEGTEEFELLCKLTCRRLSEAL